MKLTILEPNLQIEFTLKEQLLAARIHKLWLIPLSHILKVSTDVPGKSKRDIRAPGSFIPGVIKAGTYYTERGKEFWYVAGKNNSSQVLHIELADESYQRIVLNNIENHLEWEQRLNADKRK
ncbi:MAG: hypothetical protein F6K62_23060 [Sphaerospermopsis sp. SIO1G2]|nr:hypothetical protein [Sphaerospermopsis sp. SIO1G1]NET73713.1 hypothetical protein [Sphaerospermopsis sp. SIO1G2]